MYALCLTILYLFVFVLGCVIGSFLNVVIYRVPAGISIAKGRSFCPSCHETLKPYDMIPIFSFLLLRGRCRSCGAKISPRYPLVELTCGLLALLCFWRYGSSLYWLICFGAAAILLAVSFIDWGTMTIPDGLQIALAVPAVCALFWGPEPNVWVHVIGFFVISVPMLLMMLFIPDCFGGGDVKLVAICGFFLGWKCALLAAFFGLLFGGAYGVALLLRSRTNRKAHFPFGPFLSAGIFLAMLWGEELIGLYLRLAGLQ